MTSRLFALLAAGGLLIAPAWGQTLTYEAEATLAASLTDESSGARAPGAQSLLGSALLGVSYETVLDSGLQLTWSGRVRVDHDGDRPGFAGVLDECRVGVGPGACGVIPFRISPATGLAAGGISDSDDVRGTLEIASLSVSGPWGEGVFGYDAGAAALLDARAPQVLNRVSAFSPGLDPTGLALTRARNDFTGSSAKISYLSPRWLGFRAGVSFTPEANLEGADYDPRPDISGALGADLEDVWEGGVSFARTFRESGMRVRAAVTATKAESGSQAFGFNDLDAWGAGLELEQGVWSGGVRYLKSDNCWTLGDGVYVAVEAGIVRQAGKWRFGVEGGWAEDDLIGADGFSWLVGARRAVSEKFDIGLAYMQSDDTVATPTAGFRHINARNGALVLELTVRK